MSHSTFLLDSKATRDRGEWWVTITITDPNGNPVTLGFSRRGTRNKGVSITILGDTISAHQRFDKRIIKVPEITYSMWKEGNFLSNSLPSYSNFVVNNADRGLDQYAPKKGYIWLGGTIKTYFFDYNDISGTIGKKFEGRLGQPTFGLDYQLNIPVIGNEEQFNRPINNRVYRGTSYQLELFGDKTVSYGTPAAVNITGSLTLEGWFWLDALPSIGRRTWGWGSGANFPWSFGFLNDGTIVFACTIAGGLEFKISSTVLGIKKPYHIAMRVAGRDVAFLIWDDDNQTLTSEYYTNALSSSTRNTFTSGGAGTGYLLKSDSDATFTPWFDEMRVWNYYRTDQEIAQDRFRPLNNGGSIPTTCVHYTSMDHSVGTTVTDHSATAAHGTITGGGTATWLWAMEGGPLLAGTSKPDVIGLRGGIKPILVDPIRAVYQGHWGSTQAFQSYEGGNPHIMDATLASMRALMVSGAPAAGHATQYLARGYFKLPSPTPSLPISVLVNGANDGSLGYVETVSKTSRYVITRRAGIVDPTGIDTASYTTFEALTNPSIGFVYYDGKNKKIREVLDDILRSGMGWWGYMRGSNLFHIQKFSTSGAASKSYDERHIVNINDTSSENIIYGVEVRYRYNDVVHTEEQVASTIKGTASWEAFVKPYLTKSAIDESLRSKYESKGGKILTVETGLYYDNDAQILANNLLTLVKGFKQTYRIDLTTVAISDDRGQVENISYRLQDGTIVCSLDGSENYLVVTVIDKGQDGLVVHDVIKV